MFLMMKYNWFYMFLMFLNISIFYLMSTFYSMWMMMELNLLIFLIILILNNNLIMDKLMKYYLLNSFSSMIFFFSMNLNFINNNYMFLILMNMTMIMKLGMFPFHIWFVDLMMNMNWLSCFFLSTVQKYIPLIFLMFFNKSNFLLYISLFSGLISLMMIFNQNLLKKLMSYSSINHMSWMLVSLFYSTKLILFYYFSYLFINFMIMYKFYIFNINQIIELNNFFFKNKIYMLLMFFSLGGIPPFYGFMMKWLMIIYLTNMNLWIFLFILIFYSLTFLYFYIRLFTNILMMNYLNLNIIYFFNFKMFNNKLLLIMNLYFMINLLMFFMFIFF